MELGDLYLSHVVYWGHDGHRNLLLALHHLEFSLGLAHRIDGEISHDALHPGPQTALPSIACQPVENLDKAFLDDVLGHITATHDAPYAVVQPLDMLLVQKVLGLSVAIKAALDKLRIR